jgi:hypothetical protein
VIVLTLAGLGDKSDKMANWLQGWANVPGRSHVVVDYPAAPGTASIATGAAMLDEEIHHYLKLGATITVMGHSQGAEVASVWLEEHAGDAAIPDGRVQFILTGNPRRRLGGAGLVGWDLKKIGRTPETRFKVRDIARRYDGWSNADNYPGSKFWGKLRLFIGRFVDHADYRDVNIGACVLREQSGQTSYLQHP